jgi:hypothetical protein
VDNGRAPRTGINGTSGDDSLVAAAATTRSTVFAGNDTLTVARATT